VFVAADDVRAKEVVMRLARDIGTRLVIPCHYEMFEFNTASPDDFVGEAKRLGQAYRVLRCGERFSP